jgi:hypothetical protein
MNEALGLYDPLFIIPLLQVNFILFAIISGGIYFKEFSYFGTINVIGFCLGIFLLVFGIFLLSPVIVIDTQEEIEKVLGFEDGSADNATQGSFSSAPGVNRRLSFTKMSINGRDMDGNARTQNKRSSLATFKFGAIASMNDVQHDQRVNQAMYVFTPYKTPTSLSLSISSPFPLFLFAVSLSLSFSTRPRARASRGVSRMCIWGGKTPIMK